MSRVVDAAQVAVLRGALLPLLAEWKSARTLFGISSEEFWRPDPCHALGLSLLGVPIDNPFGWPWSGETSSLADVAEQWLRGCRVFEVGGAVDFGVAAQLLIGVLNHRNVLDRGAGSAPLFVRTWGSGFASRQASVSELFADEGDVVDGLRAALPEGLRDLEFPEVGTKGVILSIPRGFPTGELLVCGSRLLEAGVPTSLEVDAGGGNTPVDRDGLTQIVRDLLDFRETLPVQPKLGVQLSDGGDGAPDGAFLAVIDWLVELRMTFGGNLPVSLATNMEPTEISELLSLGLAPIYLRGLAWDACFQSACAGMDSVGVTLREELIHAKSGGCADRAMCLVGNAATYQERLRAARA